MVHSIFWRLARVANRCGIYVAPIVRHPTLYKFIEYHKIDLILDVGANAGQFGSKLRAFGYRGKILSFEPTSVAFDDLKRMSRDDKNWEVRKEAVGTIEGYADINVSESSVYSSFRTLSAEAARFDAKTSVVAIENVPVIRLESIIRAHANHRILTKIDTQGSELAVLDGMGSEISSMQGILLELPIRKLYNDTWNFTEGVEKLGQLGFVLAQTETVSTLNEDLSSALEFDCLFRRKLSDLE